MEEGIFWRIGDGQTTRIWPDKWVPNLRDNRIHYVRPEDRDPDICVSFLFTKQESEWDVQKINVFTL